jgi:AsnC-like ligand binding domain
VENLAKADKELGQCFIRKFKARINQRRIGISANALVAWKIPDTGDGDAGSLLASYPGVTHCYERTGVPGKGEYPLYTASSWVLKKGGSILCQVVGGKWNPTTIRGSRLAPYRRKALDRKLLDAAAWRIMSSEIESLSSVTRAASSESEAIPSES